MQSLTHYLGCIGDFVSGLWGLVHVPAALEDNEGETSGQELHVEFQDLPLVPATILGGESTAAPEQLPVPTTVWWLGTPAPLSQTLVDNLSRRLQPTETLTAGDRITVAFGRGRQGAAILRGERDWFSGDRCTLRNRCYVVLRGGEGDPPFFTWDLATHQRAVRTGPGGTFSPNAVCHGFPSLAEAVAFAGLPGLPRTI